MKTITALSLAALLIAGILPSPAQAADAPNWDRSLISLEITRKQYDYYQPWTKRMDTIRKNAVVIGPRQILTTADFLNDATLIRVQKGGRGKWWNGELQWIDYHANLATITVDDPTLWTGLLPVKLADPVPTNGTIQLIRWRNGILETRKGEINRLIVKRGKLSFVEHLHMEIDSEINAAGWAETAVLGDQVIGLTSSQEGNNCTVIPSAFIRFILSGVKDGTSPGIGFFDFVWQKSENPATLQYLKLEGEPRGVVIVDFVSPSAKDQLLKPRDILLQIDGHDIDNEGDYLDPVYGNLSLENLSSFHRWAGDVVRLQISREGKSMELQYTLPKARYSVELVPGALFDQEPEFLLEGGLVFVPLTEPYLRGWGVDWRRKAPFRLGYYDQEKPTPDRPARVLLSLVLPDPFTIGYQDYRFMTLDQVNGQKISRLTDLKAAFEKPTDGFHVIEFAPGESIRRMVISAEEATAATRRVMQRYGVTKDHFFATKPASGM